VRRAAKRDANESGLVSLAREIGALFAYSGPLDGWCGFRGHWTPVEIKNREGRDRYTPAQIAFLMMCKERNAPVWTWRDEADVLACLGARMGA
jgi:hypothetical protein